MISIRHREELHLRAVVIPTWVYAILWRSSFVYTSALICKSYNSLRTSRTTINHTPRVTHNYQSHSARPYKQRKTPTSEHSGVITLRKLILAPPRGDEVYCCRRDIRRLVTTIKHRHREELHLRAIVIPTWVYAILWRSSFVYTSALIRKSCNHTPRVTQDYQSHSVRRTRLSITLRTLHTTINHTPHGSINSGRPPRRSIVALSHSANSYLLLLGVTIFNIYILPTRILQ